MKIHLLGLSLILAASGCSTEVKPIATLAASPSYSEAQLKALNAKVECEGDCSPSVGMLTAVHGERTLQCTASLVGPDLVLTNRHCVPKNISPGDSCVGSMWMHFAQNGAYENRLECGELISKSTPGDGTDYALLRLSKASARPFYSISHEGFPNETQFTVEKVSPSGDEKQVRGTQSRTQCQSLYATEYVPDHVHPLSKAVAMADCKIVVGNSGSPVIDTQGQIRGVIFAIFDPLTALKQIKEYPGQVLLENLAPVSAASNLACLPLEGQEIPAACSQAKEIEQKYALEKTFHRQKMPQFEFHRGIRAEGSTLFSQFEWEVQWVYEFPNGASRLLGLPRPTCLYRPEALLSPVEAEFPIWTKDMRIDRYYRSQLSMRPDARRSMSVSLEETAEGYKVTMTGERPYMNYSKVIERCPEY